MEIGIRIRSSLSRPDALCHRRDGGRVMDGNELTRRGCIDGAIRRPGGRPLPGRRAAVARAGGRSSWRTRCGCGDKHSFGPGRRAVKRLNGSMAKEPQTSSAAAIAVGLSILTLRSLVREAIESGRRRHSSENETALRDSEGQRSPCPITWPGHQGGCGAGPRRPGRAAPWRPARPRAGCYRRPPRSSL
jgi:hypothetical protein